VLPITRERTLKPCSWSGVVTSNPYWRSRQSVVLPLGVVVGSYCFYWACREKSRWIAYAAIIGLLLTALATYKLGK